MMKCPFPECPRQREDMRFCCPDHWVRMERSVRDECLAAISLLADFKISHVAFSRMAIDFIGRSPGAMFFTG